MPSHPAGSRDARILECVAEASRNELADQADDDREQHHRSHQRPDTPVGDAGRRGRSSAAGRSGARKKIHANVTKWKTDEPRQPRVRLGRDRRWVAAGGPADSCGS